jgi:hypothetical protein
MADFQHPAKAHSSAMNALAVLQNLGALSLLVIATFIMAGLVKGVIGLGLPTVAMGLLGLAMAPSQAAALLIIPATLTTVWQLAFGGHLKGLIKRLWPLLMIFLGPPSARCRSAWRAGIGWCAAWARRCCCMR